MSNISAKIILDSVNPNGERITTWILSYPRFIHAEFMTHRVFSRNASSSRAIPISKALESVQNNPARPEFWGANQKGMQAAAELDDTQKTEKITTLVPTPSDLNSFGKVVDTPCTVREKAKDWWNHGKNVAIDLVKNLENLGVHKQIAVRVMEPWSHITVLATATDHANFFQLRAHKDAQPEFQVLAYMMLKEYVASTPHRMEWGHWHIPFGEQMPEGSTTDDMLKIATARAARLSYKTFDGAVDLTKDIELHDRLAQSGHWSPFEHCARAVKNLAGLTGNFRGWMPYRKQFLTENPTHIDYRSILDSMPEWVKAAIKRNENQN